MAQDNLQQSGQQQPSEFARALARQLVGTPAGAAQNKSAMGDVATSVLAGGQSTAANLVPGIMDIGFGATHAALSKVGDMAGAAPDSRFTQAKDFLFNRPASRLTTAIGEATGFQPSRWADANRGEYTPETTAASQAVSDAVAKANAEKRGAVGEFTAGLGALAQNPRALIPLAGESVAPLLAGGAASRGLGIVESLGGVARGAIGEGAVSAGMNMGGMDSSIDPGRAALAAAASGLAVGAITYGSGRLANRLGFGDVEAVLAGGPRVAGKEAADVATRKNLLARIAGGAFSEGVLEEMPQSAIETMLGNWAAGKPMMDGVGQAAAEGMVAGALFGGPFGVFDGKGKKPKTVTEDSAGADGKPAGSVFNINNHSTQTLLGWYKKLDKGARMLESHPELHKRATDKMDAIKRTLDRKGVPAEIVEKEAATEKFYDIYLATEAATATLENSQDPAERQAAVEAQAKGIDQMAVMAGQWPDLQRQSYERHATDLATTLEKAHAKLNDKSTPEQVAAVQEIADTLESVLGKVPQFTLGGEPVAATTEAAATPEVAATPATTAPQAPATTAPQAPVAADESVDSNELPNVLPGYTPVATVASGAAAATETPQAPVTPDSQTTEVTQSQTDVTSIPQAVDQTTLVEPPAIAGETPAPRVVSANPQVAALLKKAVAAPAKQGKKGKQTTATGTQAAPAAPAAAPAVTDPDVQKVLDYSEQFVGDPDLQSRVREAMVGKKGKAVVGGRQRRTPAARLRKLRNLDPVDFMKEGATALAIDVADADFRRIAYEIVLKEREQELQQYQMIKTQAGETQLVTRYDPITDPTEQRLIINSVMQLDRPVEKRAKWATRLGEFLNQALIKHREDPLTATVQQLLLNERIEGERKLLRRQTVMESVLLGKQKLLEEVMARRGLNSIAEAEQLVGPWFAKLGVTPEDMRWIDKKIQEAQGAGELDLAGMYKAQKKLIRELRLYEHATAQESEGFVQGKIPSGGFSNTWLAQASAFESGVTNTTDKVSAFLTSMKGARNFSPDELATVFGKELTPATARELADLDQAVYDLSEELDQKRNTVESLTRQQAELPDLIQALEEGGHLAIMQEAWDAVASNVSIETDANVPVVGFDALLENAQALKRWMLTAANADNLKSEATALMAVNQQLLADDTEGDVEHLTYEQAIDRILRETYNGIVTFTDGHMMNGEEIDDLILTREVEARNLEIRYAEAVERYDAFRDTLFTTESKARIAADNAGRALQGERTQSALPAPQETTDKGSPTQLGNTEAGAVLGQLKAQMVAPSPMIDTLETMRANETYYKWVPNSEPSAAGPQGGKAYSMVGADEKIYTINKYGNEWKIFQTKSPDGVPSSVDADEWVATVPRQNPNKAQDGTSAKEVIIKVSSDEVAAAVNEPLRMVLGPFEVGNPNAKGDPAVTKMLQNPDYYLQNEDTHIEVTEMDTLDFINRVLVHRGIVPKKLGKKALGLRVWQMSQSAKYKAQVDALVERFQRGEKTTAPTINYRANDIDGLARALAAAHPSVAMKTIPVVEVYRTGARSLKKIDQKAQTAKTVTVDTSAAPASNKVEKAPKIKAISNPKAVAVRQENIRNKRRETDAAMQGVRVFPGKTTLGNASSVNADDKSVGIARDPETYKAENGVQIWIARLTPQQVLDSLEGTEDQSVMAEYFSDEDGADIEEHVGMLAADMNNTKSRTTYAIPWVDMTSNTSSGKLIAQAARQAGQKTLRVMVIADPTMQESIERHPNGADYQVLETIDANMAALENAKPRTTVAINQYVTDPSSISEVLDAVRRFMPGINTDKDIIIVQSFAHLPLVLDMTDLILPSDVPGFFVDGKAYLIADNINVGEEIPTLMHEVGVHAGMDDATRVFLASKIKEMINSGSDIESRLAIQASNNVASSILALEMNGFEANEADADNELVAYFVQYATSAGINPTRMETVPTPGLKAFFNRVMAWVRKAWRSFMPTSSLSYTPQDIVDMAFGAAQTAFRQPMSAEEQQAKVYFQTRAESRLEQRVREKLPPEVGYSLNTFAKFARTSKDLWSFTSDFVDMVEGFFAADPITGVSPVRSYFDTVFRRAAERGRLESLIQHAVDETATWTRAQRKTVNDFMRDSTTQEEWGFIPDWEGAIEPENVNDELVARFNAMNPSQRSVIRRVFKLADQLYADEQAALRGEIERSYQTQLTRAEADPKAKYELLQEMQEDLKEFDARMGNRKAAWLPLKRFGEHAVVWISQELRDAMADGATRVIRNLKQDPNHYHVSFFESHVSAQRAEAELTNKFMGKAGKVEMFDRQAQLNKPEIIPFNFMNTWKQQLESQEVLDSAGRVTNSTASGLAKALTKMYISQLSETSVRKSELNRINVEGADEDMLRGFVTHGRGMAAMISAIKMNKETIGALQELKNQAKEGDNLSTRERRTEIVNEIIERQAIMLDYNPSVAQQRTMGFTSVWMLLTSPAYYMQNATQPWMLTLPVLGAEHGLIKSSKALTSAYKDVHKIWNKGLSGELADLSRHANDEERDMLENLRARGELDVGMSSDLGSFEGPKSRGMAWINARHQNMVHAVRTVEIFNRGATALASYRLARQNGQSHEAASMYAQKQVQVTQGDYSGINAPRILSAMGGWAKVAAQFRKFQLIQIGLLVRSVANIVRAQGGAEKLVASKQLAYILSTHMAVGGALGLPMANIIGWAAAMIAGGDDDPKDAELLARKAIGNKQVADLILKGLPAMAGIDMSGRLGMGQTFSVMPFVEMDFSRDGYAAMFTQLLGGPSAALGMSMWDAAGLMFNNNFALGAAQMMPRGLRDMGRAVIYANQGITRRNATQDTAISADDLSWFDLGGQFAGWPTKSLTDRQNVNRWLTDTEAHFNERVGELQYKYTHAATGEEKTRVREEFRKLQETRREYGFKPQKMTVLTDAAKKKAKREQDTYRGVPVRNSNRQFVEGLLN